MTEADILDLFPHRDHIIRYDFPHSRSGRFRGHGFVSFPSVSFCTDAIARLHGFEVNGRGLVCRLANDPGNSPRHKHRDRDRGHPDRFHRMDRGFPPIEPPMLPPPPPLPLRPLPPPGRSHVDYDSVLDKFSAPELVKLLALVQDRREVRRQPEVDLSNVPTAELRRILAARSAPLFEDE
jgi:RNA recognition motif-containing protein